MTSAIARASGASSSGLAAISAASIN